ncbi:MAG: type IV secretory system conjugative DNA transfer family protein [Clostridia bacterium]|nr:type IV secretory system conjugative DNA transfer family protein [Clostridia bacterium]
MEKLKKRIRKRIKELSKLKKAIICIAVAAFVLYWIGIGAQAIHLQFKRFTDGNLFNPAATQPVNWLPISGAYNYLFTTVIGLVFFAALVIFIIWFVGYLRARSKWAEGTEDEERNFTQGAKGTYGTAKWLTKEKAEEVLEFGKIEDIMGTVLGKYENGVVSLPSDTRLNQHIAIMGASGTGKSRGFSRTHIIQSVRRAESIIVTDPKGELYNSTAAYCKEHGYEVKVLNLVSPEHSDYWNVMDEMCGNTLRVQTLAEVIIQNTNVSSKGGDRFWDDSETNLVKAVALMVELDKPSDGNGTLRKTLPIIYKLIAGNSEKDLISMFARKGIVSDAHPAYIPLQMFLQADPKVRASVVTGFGTRLHILQDKTIQKMLSHSNIDLSLPAKKPCAYYIILRDNDRSLDFIASLFFTFLFVRICEYADSQPDLRCTIPVNLILDEFSNIGSIPNFEQVLSTIRSREVHVSIILQNIAQLKNRYPNDVWSEILGNCDTQILLGCTDEYTAQYFSDRSGEMTVIVDSNRYGRKTFAPGQIIDDHQVMTGVGKRPLLTMHEVLTLPSDELLICLRGNDVLKAKKFDYTEHPESKYLKELNCRNYNPNTIFEQPEQPAPPRQTGNEDTIPTSNSPSDTSVKPKPKPKPKTDQEQPNLFWFESKSD